MRVSYVSIGAASIVCGIAASSSNGAIDYASDIRPIFATNCYKCHGPQKAMNGLRVDSRDREAFVAVHRFGNRVRQQRFTLWRQSHLHQAQLCFRLYRGKRAEGLLRRA